MGSTIIFALTVLTPVLIASGTVLSSLHAYADEVDRRFHGVTTQLVAASGAHEGLARLDQDLAFRGAFEVVMNGGRSTVDVSQIAGEGTADVADDRFQVRSEGWLNGPADAGAPRDGVRWFRSVVNTTVKARFIRFPIQQTLFMADPEATVFFNGTAFRIAGADGADDPEAVLPGIGIAGEAGPLVSQIPMSLQQYVTGMPGEYFASVHPTAPVDLPAWIDRFKASPTIHWESAIERLDAGTIGTEYEPAVAVADGNLVVRGNIAGHGVLVVLGDFRVTGSLDFTGLILVGGSATLTGSGGNQTRHRGALLVDGNDTGRDLEVMGDVQIQYDSAALEQFVGEYVDGIEVVTWDHDLDAGLPDLEFEVEGVP